MPPSVPPELVPLSEIESLELGGLLEDRCPFDRQALLGFLHAVIIAPGRPHYDTWLPYVLPNGMGRLDGRTWQRMLDLLSRLNNEVALALHERKPITPRPDDADACRAFTYGYTVGASTDPAWLEDPGRWVHAAMVSFMGGHFDLVLPEMLSVMQKNPDMPTIERLDAVITSTYELFLGLPVMDGARPDKKSSALH